MALLIILCFLCSIANNIYVYTIWKTLYSVFYLNFTQRPDLFGIGVVEFKEIEDVEIAVEESYYILEYQAIRQLTQRKPAKNMEKKAQQKSSTPKLFVVRE